VTHLVQRLEEKVLLLWCSLLGADLVEEEGEVGLEATHGDATQGHASSALNLVQLGGQGDIDGGLQVAEGRQVRLPPHLPCNKPEGSTYLPATYTKSTHASDSTESQPTYNHIQCPHMQDAASCSARY
jgi:hypothetical protein